MHAREVLACAELGGGFLFIKQLKTRRRALRFGLSRCCKYPLRNPRKRASLAQEKRIYNAGADKTKGECSANAFRCAALSARMRLGGPDGRLARRSRRAPWLSTLSRWDRAWHARSDTGCCSSSTPESRRRTGHRARQRRWHPQCGESAAGGSGRAQKALQVGSGVGVRQLHAGSRARNKGTVEGAPACGRAPWIMHTRAYPAESECAYESTINDFSKRPAPAGSVLPGFTARTARRRPVSWPKSFTTFSIRRRRRWVSSCGSQARPRSRPFLPSKRSPERQATCQHGR